MNTCTAALVLCHVFPFEEKIKDRNEIEGIE